MMYIGGAGGGTPQTALCRFIRENNITLPKDLAAQVVAYVALSLLDDGDYAGALSILRQAESRGIRDRRLVDLRRKIEAISDLQQAVSTVIDDIDELFNTMSRQNRIDEALLSKLRRDIGELENAINEARSLGIKTDTRILSYAQDIYRLLDAVKGQYQVVGRASDLLTRFYSYVQTSFSRLDDVEDLAAALRGLERFGNEAASLIASIQRSVSGLESLQLKSAEARRVRDQLLSQFKGLLPLLQIINILGSEGKVLGVWLSRVQELIRDAYENPSNSPFGAARNSFINVVSSLLSGIRDLRQRINQVVVPAGVSPELQNIVEGIKKFGLGVADSIASVLKTMKYYTTFNDYRWNGLWEAAESRAGYDLGHISKADVQRYEYKCDSSGCRLVERSGVTGWLAKHMPEEMLEFWTTAEDVLQYIEMYNKWTMNHAKNPILRALGHIGYMGAGIISAVGSLAAPRMLAAGLNALKELVKQWGLAIYHHNLDELKNVASTTWRMFFGSKEAALTTLGAFLLSTAVGGLMARGLPKGARLPLSRAILGNLLQGDIIGAGLVLVERALPMARISGVARTLIESGIVKASSILDDAGIMARVLQKAGRIQRIKTLLQADKLHDIISKALKNADNLKEAHANMEKIIKDIGVEGIAEEVARYRAAKTTVISNLGSLKIHAPTRINRLKNIARQILRKDIPVEELPKAVKEELARVKSSEELVAEARRLTAENSEVLLQKLASNKVIGEKTLRALRILDDAINVLEKQGRRGLAEALRRFKENYERFIAETERLADIKKTLDELDRLRFMAKKRGLWKEIVELNRRKKLPGKGWLRKKKVNLEEYLSKYRKKVTTEYHKRLELKNQIERQLDLVANKLDLLGEARIDLFLKNLQESLRKAGFEDLALELERVASESPKIPLMARLGMAIERLAGRMFDRLERARYQIMNAIDDVEVQAKAAEIEKALPGATLSKKLMVRLGKAYLAGLRVAEKLVEQLEMFGRALEDAGLRKMKPELETRMIERLAELVREEYGKTSLENLAFLKGLKKILEAYEKTPIGALLSELDRAVSKTIEAVEKPLESQLENMRLRKLAHERLGALLSQNGVVVNIARSLARKLDELADKMEKSLENTPHGGEILHRAYRMAEAGIPTEEVVGELKRYAQSKGYQVPGTFWRALEDYVETRQAVRDLNALAKLAMEKGYLTLDDVQRAINRLARIDLDLAWKTDWITIKSYLDDLMRKLAEVKELAKRADAADVLKNIEETEKVIRQVEKKSFKQGPFSELTAGTRIPKGYSQIMEAMEGIYDILMRGLGEDKVKGLRRLLDEFEAKLEKGVFDEQLLKKMRWELRKIKLKNIHKALRADLDRLVNRLGEIAARIKGGREAALIEHAISELADEIKQLEEGLEAEKGWVSLDRIIEVSKARFVRVPKEFAEQVARILQEREKTIKIKTRKSHTVTIKRRIEVKPNGVMHIRYELRFPGKRKVVYDELVVVDATGKVNVFKQTYHDPEVAKAVQAYEEARLGLRTMDELALQGKEIEEVLRKSLAELDPDYEVLSKIAFMDVNGMKPVIAPLRRAGIEVLEKILQGATVSAIGSLGVMEEQLGSEKEEAIRKLMESLPPTFFEELREAIRRLSLDMAMEKDKLLLSLTAPLVLRLSPIYYRVRSDNIPQSLLKEAQKRIGNIIGGAPLNTENYGLKVVWPEKEDWRKWNSVYVVLTEANNNILTIWENPDRIVIITIPGDGEITLPAYIIGNALIILLPPFVIEVPSNIEQQLYVHLTQEQQISRIEKQQATYIHVPSVPPPEGGAGGLTIFSIPPIIPVLPWMGGAQAYGQAERERLNIV